MNSVLWQMLDPRFMLDHRFTRAHASEYLDGDLPEEPRRRIDRHASVCPQCYAVLTSLRRLIDALPDLARSPRAGIADAVLERLPRDD